MASPDPLPHFEFMGRMLGKAVYDQMLVELPLASFFISKLCGQRPFFNDLASLDPDVHKNLLFVKTYEGNVEQDLSLDFSIADDSMGAGAKVIKDLVPGGRDIAVTNTNRIKYIYYMAEYRPVTHPSNSGGLVVL